MVLLYLSIKNIECLFSRGGKPLLEKWIFFCLPYTFHEARAVAARIYQHYSWTSSVIEMKCGKWCVAIILKRSVEF